ncbi:hypothetical protein ACRASX_08760 [Flavobacterium sp. TMP13]|uniref:hypothetical protein n=1 Tax=Flavobacterium sp. TMP13 TaxID=3425950 RepID=UPI003D772B0F
MPKIKINTFGIGIEIRQLHLDEETRQQWIAIAKKRNRLLTDLILDPFFYHRLKNKRFKQVSDIDSTSVIGMINNPKSHIEIWFDRKKVIKIDSYDLFNEMLLFPLFHLEQNQSFLKNNLEDGLYVVQKTIGLLQSEQLEVSSHNLTVDDFTFHISKYENEDLLTQIKYQNQNFNLTKSDTIITYQNAFEIK